MPTAPRPFCAAAPTERGMPSGTSTGGSGSHVDAADALITLFQ
eukprot:gene6678-1194_t